MRPLANAEWDRPASILYTASTGHLFLAFGEVCADQISSCPLDRGLPYKNLIMSTPLGVGVGGGGGGVDILFLLFFKKFSPPQRWRPF